MEFDIGNGTLILPELHITIMAIVIIYLLVKWSKELETRRFTVFLYFLASAYIIPLFSYHSTDSEFQLWFPVGFILMFFYLRRPDKYHSAKIKASWLGLSVALYQIIMHML